MTPDIILLTFAAALVGVVGAVVGVYASLHTVELTGKRDYYQRLVKLWKLLDFERSAIVKQSEDNADHLDDSESPTPLIISSFSTPAWLAIRANAEFIADTPQELLNRLVGSYGLVERLNITLTNYDAYYVGANMTSAPQFSDHIRNYHRNINLQRSILVLEFRDLAKQIDPQIDMYEKALKRQQKKVDAFSWGSRIIFGILVVIIIAYVVYLLFWHH